MKFEESKTQAVLNLITENMQESIDQTGEIPTLFAETVADELAYRENQTYDNYFLVLVEKALDELQSLGLVSVSDNNKIVVL